MSDLGSQASVDDIYTERNQAVAVLVRLALRLGYDAWVNQSDPEWPIVSVDLPFGGQVSWHIPAEEFHAFFPRSLPPHTYTNAWKWDGHDNAEKAKRLIREARGA